MPCAFKIKTLLYSECLNYVYNVVANCCLPLGTFRMIRALSSLNFKRMTIIHNQDGDLCQHSNTNVLKSRGIGGVGKLKMSFFNV